MEWTSWNPCFWNPGCKFMPPTNCFFPKNRTHHRDNKRYCRWDLQYDTRIRRDTCSEQMPNIEWIAHFRPPRAPLGRTGWRRLKRLWFDIICWMLWGFIFELCAYFKLHLTMYSDWFNETDLDNFSRNRLDSNNCFDYRRFHCMWTGGTVWWQNWKIRKWHWTSMKPTNL